MALPVLVGFCKIIDHYATFNQFTEAIFNFFRTTLPEKWPEFRDTVTDNFRVVSLKEYKVI